MPRTLAALGLLLIPLASACGPSDPGDDRPDSAATDTVEGPRLGVLVVVDQLRGDLLDRYDDLFTGGFRRLHDGGAVFTNATHDHAVTATAPGHATVATGRSPRRHALVGNAWFERVGDDWRSIYAVSDTTVRILADPGLPGRSPANLRVDGIGDWIAAAHPRARLIGISRKDRGAIPLVGHAAQDAYWLALEAGVGGFTTSTYYRDTLPAWVREANAALGPGLWGDTVWTYSGAEGTRDRARPDAEPGEADGVHTTFPHRTWEEVDMLDRGAWGGWLQDSPAPDHAVTTLALRALGELELGRRGTVDLLGLSYSSVDGVGHAYGPLSLEQLDNLLRLDRELGVLMDSLDARVGAGNWVLALTADHGVLDLPEWREQQGLPAHRVTPAEYRAVRQAAVEVALDDGGVAAARVLRESELIAEAYPFARLREGVPADSFEALFVDNFVEGRVTGIPGLDVAVRWKEGSILGYVHGTTHGNPYHYDRWVPFVVYGAGVSAGIHPERVATVDVAPTLAALLGIPVPEDLDGQNRLR